jgi:hypothetical protein
MAPWGINSTNKSVPKWWKNLDITRVFATNRGWVFRHFKGPARYWDEILVKTEADTANAIGNSVCNYTYFTNTAASYVCGANCFVTLAFNKVITVAGAPTIAITGQFVNATATYSNTLSSNSTVGSNKLHFKFTVPAAAQLTYSGILGNTNFTVAETVTQGGVTATVLSQNSTTLTVGSVAGGYFAANSTTIVGTTSHANATISSKITDTLSVLGQSINLSGGTLTDSSGMAAVLSFTNANAYGVNGITSASANVVAQ